ASDTLKLKCSVRPMSGRDRAFHNPPARRRKCSRRHRRNVMPFQLPPLPYAHSALEPTIDARTMQIHHEKHHGGYVKKLNTAVSGTEWTRSSIEELLRRVDETPE